MLRMRRRCSRRASMSSTSRRAGQRPAPLPLFSSAPGAQRDELHDQTRLPGGLMGSPGWARPTRRRKALEMTGAGWAASALRTATRAGCLVSCEAGGTGAGAASSHAQRLAVQGASQPACLIYGVTRDFRIWQMVDRLEACMRPRRFLASRCPAPVWLMRSRPPHPRQGGGDSSITPVEGRCMAAVRRGCGTCGIGPPGGHGEGGAEAPSRRQGIAPRKPTEKFTSNPAGGGAAEHEPNTNQRFAGKRDDRHRRCPGRQAAAWRWRCCHEGGKALSDWPCRFHRRAEDGGRGREARTLAGLVADLSEDLPRSPGGGGVCRQDVCGGHHDILISGVGGCASACGRAPSSSPRAEIDAEIRAAFFVALLARPALRGAIFH